MISVDGSGSCRVVAVSHGAIDCVYQGSWSGTLSPNCDSERQSPQCQDHRQARDTQCEQRSRMCRRAFLVRDECPHAKEYDCDDPAVSRETRVLTNERSDRILGAGEQYVETLAAAR